MCPPGYHHNGFVATHALGHIVFHDYIYIMPILLCEISALCVVDHL